MSLTQNIRHHEKGEGVTKAQRNNHKSQVEQMQTHLSTKSHIKNSKVALKILIRIIMQNKGHKKSQ